MEEVLKCPFCGDFDVTMDDDVYGSDWVAYRVRCRNYTCEAQGPYRNTVPAAYEAWNQRCK